MNLGTIFRRLSVFTPVLVCLALTVTIAPPAWTQSTSAGTVSGQVTDPQGAAIPGAEIKLFDASINTSQNTVSNDAGRFIFSSVPPGKYDITITKQGFSTFKVPFQSVQVGNVLTVNATLQVGATSTTVEVTATAGAELQTMNATVGQTITGQQLASLPSVGRDANALFTLQPAVLPGGQVAGAVADQNMYSLD